MAQKLHADTTCTWTTLIMSLRQTIENFVEAVCPNALLSHSLLQQLCSIDDEAAGNYYQQEIKEVLCVAFLRTSV